MRWIFLWACVIVHWACVFLHWACVIFTLGTCDFWLKWDYFYSWDCEMIESFVNVVDKMENIPQIVFWSECVYIYYSCLCLACFQLKAKSQLRIAGVSQQLYWIAICAVDFAQYMIVGVALLLSFVVFQVIIILPYFNMPLTTSQSILYLTNVSGFLETFPFNLKFFWVNDCVWCFR